MCASWKNTNVVFPVRRKLGKSPPPPVVPSAAISDANGEIRSEERRPLVLITLHCLLKVTAGLSPALLHVEAASVTRTSCFSHQNSQLAA